jgi:hypothetical protein
MTTKKRRKQPFKKRFLTIILNSKEIKFLSQNKYREFYVIFVLSTGVIMMQFREREINEPS